MVGSLTEEGLVSPAGRGMPGSELHVSWIPGLGPASGTTGTELAEKSDFHPPYHSLPFFRDCQRIVHYYMGVIFFEDVRGSSSLRTQFRTDLHSLQSHRGDGDCTGTAPAWLCSVRFEVTYRAEEIITEIPVF